MTMFQTAELRRWWREGTKERPVICGYVYNDPDDFWEDGELAVIDIKDLIDSGQFFVLTSGGKTVFKLNRDDEIQKKTS